MDDLTALIHSMQFPFLVDKNAFNTSGQPREVVTWTLPGASEPDSLRGEYSGWRALSNSERQTVIEQLEHIETFLNVDFRLVSNDNDPDLIIGKVNLSGNTAGLGGYAASYFGNTVTDFDSFALFDNAIDLSRDGPLILHELGHALGLKHPFDTPTVPAGTDNNKYTVMSYSANPDNGLDSDAMMLYDVLALQDIWGAAEYNAGNSRYTGKRTDTVDAVWDTGGVDIFDATGYKKGVTISLREGEFSRFGNYDDVVITFGTVIENATGGDGWDQIDGNATNNVLLGGRGADGIRGNSGNDQVRGEGGNDKLSGGWGKDKVFGGGGRDIVVGNQGNDVLVGGKHADTFVFREGYDRDLIRDFRNDLDVIDLTDFGFDNRREALEFATQKRKAVVFEFEDGDRLKVKNGVLTELADDLLI